MMTPAITTSMSKVPAPGIAMDQGFASALGRVSAISSEGKIKQAAEQLVATALVQPILASMTRTPFREGPFAPGPVEKRFMPLLHRHLSDRIVSSSNFGLVKALTDQLTPRPTVEVTA
ncbi:MAG: hypothetical protein MK089_07135 [Phycisphaerales bacterium]|nr:hypothetical protein [Phycisphaerales bacterium]